MPRSVLIFALCLPLAVLMGFMLSDPLAGKNMVMGGLVVILLTMPLLIAYHHRAVLWMAGTYMNLYLLKGQPHVWMILAIVSFGFMVISKPLGKGKMKPVWTKELVASLIVLGLVLLVTSRFTGGISLKSAGSQTFGGKKYIYLFCAIMGFFALTSQALPRKTALKDATIYILGPVTAAFSNIAYMLGPNFYFLFLLFPVDIALGQAQSELAVDFGGLTRVGGFGPAGLALVGFCLLRWGLRGVLDITKPWRALTLIVALSLSLISGFRSAIGISFLLFAFQFFAEGLHRTKFIFVVSGIGIVAFGLLAAFARELPMAAQRGLSFLPIKVDPVAAMDAKGSTQWRLEMWSVVVQDIPKYLWLGKGYAINPADVYFAEESARRGFATGYDFAIKAGDFHNGPLSVIIPFGIWGALAFGWFLVAAFKVVWNNYHYGLPEFRRLNVFLLSLFLARLVFFMAAFGALEVDLWQFCTVVAVSLCVNGGMRRKPVQAALRYDAPRSESGKPKELVTV